MAGAVHRSRILDLLKVCANQLFPAAATSCTTIWSLTFPPSLPGPMQPLLHHLQSSQTPHRQQSAPPTSSGTDPCSLLPSQDRNFRRSEEGIQETGSRPPRSGAGGSIGEHSDREAAGEGAAEEEEGEGQ